MKLAKALLVIVLAIPAIVAGFLWESFSIGWEYGRDSVRRFGDELAALNKGRK